MLAGGDEYPRRTKHEVKAAEDLSRYRSTPITNPAAARGRKSTKRRRRRGEKEATQSKKKNVCHGNLKRKRGVAACFKRTSKLHERKA